MLSPRSTRVWTILPLTLEAMVASSSPKSVPVTRTMRAMVARVGVVTSSSTGADSARGAPARSPEACFSQPHEASGSAAAAARRRRWMPWRFRRGSLGWSRSALDAPGALLFQQASTGTVPHGGKDGGRSGDVTGDGRGQGSAARGVLGSPLSGRRDQESNEKEHTRDARVQQPPKQQRRDHSARNAVAVAGVGQERGSDEDRHDQSKQ